MKTSDNEPKSSANSQPDHPFFAKSSEHTFFSKGSTLQPVPFFQPTNSPMENSIQRQDEEETEKWSVERAMSYMLAQANAGRGWNDIKNFHKRGELTWGGGNDIANHPLDAIHARRKQIVEESIAAVRQEVKRQVYLMRLKLQTGLEPGYVPNEEDQSVMEQIMANIKDLEGGGSGSTDPTSDLDVTLSGDGTDIAVKLLNNYYRNHIPEGRTGVSFAYLYDVNYYPAAYVPDEDATFAQKVFAKNRDLWRDETITNPDLKERIDESEEITAWLHVRLDVDSEQWKPIHEKLSQRFIQYRENKTPPEDSPKTFAEEINKRAQERESVGEGSEGNDRLVAETEKFGEVAAQTLDARERYFEAKRKEQEVIDAIRDAPFHWLTIKLLNDIYVERRREVELAYAELMQWLEKTSVYANEGMFTRGAIVTVVANMQNLADWGNHFEKDFNVHVSGATGFNRAAMDDEVVASQMHKKMAVNAQIRGTRKLQLQSKELESSIIEHYGRVLHELNHLKGNPVEKIEKIGKYTHRFYRSIYEWQNIQEPQRQIITNNQLIWAQQLEGLKKGKISMSSETERAIDTEGAIAHWASVDSSFAINQEKLTIMENLFGIPGSVMSSMVHVKSYIERTITDLFNQVL
jgi:hypothetical protein